MAGLISQFDLNDNGSSAPATHPSQPSYLLTHSPTCSLTYSLAHQSLAVDFDEFCELMTREAGGAPIEAVREAARQVVETPVMPVTPTQQAQAPQGGLERRWWGGESKGGPTLHTA